MQVNIGFESPGMQVGSGTNCRVIQTIGKVVIHVSSDSEQQRDEISWIQASSKVASSEAVSSDSLKGRAAKHRNDERRRRECKRLKLYQCPFLEDDLIKPLR